jgi:REP element-mobilizing transposase RayT
MSQPQQYLPGTFYEVTRRCVERAHKLTPNYPNSSYAAPAETGPSSVEQLYKYATARYAARYDIEVIAVCVMSNHVHEVLFDRRGEVSKFLQERNAMFANMVKVRYGLPSSIFDKPDGTYNRLEGATAIAEKIAYAMANPVEAGLVASPEEWPGMISAVEHLFGASTVVARPREYLAQDDKTNAPAVTFRLGAPKEAVELFGSVTEMATQVATHLSRKIKSARRRHSGRFAGRLRVLATNPHTRAKTFEKFGGRVPRLTTAGDLAVARRLIAEMRAFRKAHRIALEAVKGGKRRVTFPAGTGKMHLTYGYPRQAYVPLPAA